MKERKGLIIICCVLWLWPASARAALPFITDDTGTQGAGKFQIEAAGEYNREKETTSGIIVKESGSGLVPTLTYGVMDQIDLFIAVPYVWYSAEEEGAGTVRENGAADSIAGMKWRCYEREGMSIGIKPFLIIPTGNEEKGLGSGETGYGTIVIMTKVEGPWTVHADFGYLRNQNEPDERKDLWQASAAVTFKVVKNLVLGADMGIVTNRDKTSREEPVYLLGGMVYSVNDDLELSLGLKAGLNASENDWSVLPGVTHRF